VEVADVPVHGPDPVDILFNLYRSHVVLILKKPSRGFQRAGG